MKLRKIISLFVAVAMMVQVLPLSLFANDGEEVAETYTVGELTYADSSILADSDELLEGYVEELLGTGSNSGIMLLATYTGEDVLSGVALDLYEQFKAGVEKIASGEETSSVITVDFEYTYAELGSDNYTDAANAFIEQLHSNFNLACDFLQTDCPYELYWYDKTVGIKGAEYTYTIYDSGDSISCSIPFIFAVATEYQGSSSTTVDSSKVTAAKTAAAYAQTIASQYAGYSDEDKLTAFKDIICSLVSYYS